MLKFTVPPASAAIVANAAIGSLVIDSIVFYNGEQSIFTKRSTDDCYIGNIVHDESGIGDYVVIDLEDTSSSNYTITKLELKSGSTVVAESPDLSVVKLSGKQLKLRITAQFDGAIKCAFNNVSIGLPYATKFRQGVIRLASQKDNPNESGISQEEKTRRELQLDSVVYSASDTVSKIEEYIQSSDQYVQWDLSGDPAQPDVGSVTVDHLTIENSKDPTKKAVITVNTTATNGNLVINNPITGSTVSSSPTYGSTTIATSAINGSTALVNETYISNLYSNVIETAVTETDASRKLVTSHAVRAYYKSADGSLVHKTGNETITGDKTFSNSIIANNSISGTAIYSITPYNTEDWASTNKASKLPTVAAVRVAIEAGDATVTKAFQSADSSLRASLQEQIDALNAGQNLADIVATKPALDNLPTNNLQTGDKVQVLVDETHDNASTVYSLIKGENGNPDMWTYIGKYGQDSYTKSEADDKYFLKSNVVASSTDPLPTSSDTQTPTFASVTSMIETAGGAYVKLVSSNNQTIASPLTIKATDQSTAALSIQDGQHITSNSTLTITAANYKNTVTSIYNVANCTYTVILNNESAISLATYGVIINGASTIVSDVSGSMVASYRDKQGSTLQDGRLVTVDFLNDYTGDLSAYVKKDTSNSITGNNTFSGSNSFNTNQTTFNSATEFNSNNTFNIGQTTFNGSTRLNGSVTGDSIYSTYSASTWNILSVPTVTTDTATKIPTVAAVDGAINAAILSVSNLNKVGCIGLFIYTEYDGNNTSGAEKGYGAEVSGAYLKPVGMSLPMSGQISYKAVTTIPAVSGTWKLLSIAVKRTATEPCLVLAQKVSE